MFRIIYTKYWLVMSVRILESIINLWAYSIACKKHTDDIYRKISHSYWYMYRYECRSIWSWRRSACPTREICSLSYTLCLSLSVCLYDESCVTRSMAPYVRPLYLSLCVQWRDSASPKHAYKTRIMNVRTQDTF